MSRQSANEFATVELVNEVQIQALLVEFRRILKPDGKMVLVWPHAKATSVCVLGMVHFVMYRFLGKKT